MIVEPPVLGREHRLDQMIRKIRERDRARMLDPAAADLIAVTVEKDHRELGLFQPILVGRLAECRNREREGHQEPTGAKGGELGQRLNHHPAAPPCHVETIHKVAEPFERLACHPAAAKQSGIEAGIEFEQIGPEALPPIRPFIEWSLVLHDRSYGLLIRRCHGGPVVNYINSLIRLAFRPDLRSNEQPSGTQPAFRSEVSQRAPDWPPDSTNPRLAPGPLTQD